jgi:hypothetical protein
MLSLDGLQADKVPFELGDGKTIFFRMVRDFDLQEYAAWQRLQTKTFPNIKKRRETAVTDDQFAKAEAKNRVACVETVNLVLPDLPTDTLDALTPGQLDNLASMCIQVATGRYNNSQVGPDDISAIQEQYPDLPVSFINSLSKRQSALLLPEKEPAKN